MGMAKAKIQREKEIHERENWKMVEALRMETEIKEQSKKMVIEMFEEMTDFLSLAIDGAIKEDLGWGDTRYNRLLESINKRMPDHFMINHIARDKITDQKKYDVVELLLQLGCDHRCKRTKEKCNVYKILYTTGIPVYEPQDKICEYRVTTGKMSKKEIKQLKLMLNDRHKRMLQAAKDKRKAAKEGDIN